jgi:ABC-type transport system involved in multi-copper enzyme maturation permease subunit
MTALRAEWTKLWTMPSTIWLLPGVAIFTALLGALVVASVDVSLCPTPTTCDEDTVKLSLAGTWAGQVVVAVVAVLAVTSEYSTRTIRLTLSAEPRRVRVLAAKAAVVSTVALAAGLLGVAASLAVGRQILPGNGFTASNGYPPLSLADGATVRAAVGTVLYLALIGLLALGIGTIARDTAGALVAVLGLMFAGPMLSGFINDPRWQERLNELSPVTAGMAVQATRHLDRLPIEPWNGLGVLAAYAAGAVVLGGAVLVARDA